MRTILTLKHWQLFGLLIALPMLLQIVAMSFAFSSNDPTALFYIVPVIMIVYIGLFFGWFYSLGTNLYKKLPSPAMLSLTRFKIFLFTPIVYIVLIACFAGWVLSNLANEVQPDAKMFFLIIPMHLFSIFCMLYCIYFIAKALKTVEWQRPVTFGDYAGEFFLIWFFPVGIWIIQPRINKLFDEASADTQVLDSNMQ